MGQLGINAYCWLAEILLFFNTRLRSIGGPFQVMLTVPEKGAAGLWWCRVCFLHTDHLDTILGP